MKNVLYNGVMVLFILSMVACSEKFLETTATDTYNEGNWWKTESHAISSINGVYQVMRNSVIGSVEHLREENYTPNSFDGSTSQVAEGTHTPGNVGTFQTKWNVNYRGIGRANNVLDNIDRVPMDENLKHRVIGEAKFLRAFFYSNLVKYYGGVPLFVESPDFAKHGQLPRNTRQEVIDQILKDLDDAASVLPVSYTGSNIGRATKGAALGLKTRVLLYESRWAEAASAAKAVMDMGHYELFPNYRGLFLSENQNNKEVIFDIQYKTPEYPHNLDVILELQINLAPTPDLVNDYLMMDGKSISESPLFNPDQPYENRDPRLHQTVVVPGYMFIGRIVPDNKYFSTGYGFKKYTTFKDDVIEQTPKFQSDLNYIILRYADVLLMYAEAQNEATGPDASVYNALKLIRSRAGMPEVEAGLSKDQMREVIRHERRIELAGEALYYHDIRRWRTAEVVMNSQVYNRKGEVISTRTFNPQRDYLWPIHEITIQENPALEQNPNY